MRRAVLTLGGTLAGIAALLALKFHPAASSLAAGISPAPVTTGTPPASAAPRTSGSAKASTPTHSSSPGPTTKSSAKSSTQSTAARTITGAVDNTQYGPMQVAITVAGGKITKVTVVQQTNLGGQSQQIDANAIPQLTAETLAAQNARIDAVSGASYTSAGYIQSLQSAIDQAKL